MGRSAVTIAPIDDAVKRKATFNPNLSSPRTIEKTNFFNTERIHKKPANVDLMR